jgi:hypothetical protein
MTLQFFLIQETAYTLDSAYISRYYEQGIKHTLSNGINSDGGIYPYTNGDTYISNIETYRAALLTSLLPTLANAKLQKISALQTFAYLTYKEGKVVYNTWTFKSDSSTLSRLIQERAYSESQGSGPVGYYVTDDGATERALTLVQLQALTDLIMELYYLTDLIIDDHVMAINALTTVQDVFDYDYTIGSYPTVTYSP